MSSTQQENSLPELTAEKSQQQAEVIEIMKYQLLHIDVDYCKALAQAMFSQANRQEALSVLNPGHPQEKNDALRASAISLTKLIEFINSLKECDRLKARIARLEQKRSEVENMFI